MRPEGLRSRAAALHPRQGTAPTPQPSICKKAGGFGRASLPSGCGRQPARGSKSAEIDAAEALPVGTRGATRGQLPIRENPSVYGQISKFGTCPRRKRHRPYRRASDQPARRAAALELVATGDASWRAHATHQRRRLRWAQSSAKCHRQRSLGHTPTCSAPSRSASRLRGKPLGAFAQSAAVPWHAPPPRCTASDRSSLPRGW